MIHASSAQPKQQLWLLASLCATVLCFSGCPDKRPGTTAIFANQKKATSRPTSRPNAPFAPFAGKKKSGAVEQGVDMPLNMTGHTSVERLKAHLKALSAEDQAGFERAYRLTFTLNKAKRNPQESRELLNKILAKYPKFGPAYRTMGYTYVDDGFQTTKAVQWYEQSVQADPNYALGHYGLAFMLPMMNRLEEGYDHFVKAMKLGLDDERNLKAQFYKQFGGISSH